MGFVNRKTTMKPTNKTTEKAVVPIEPMTIDSFDPERDVEQAKKAAKALMAVIMLTKPLVMNGKKYLYFEHWQTIGKFFRESPGIEWTRKTEHG